MAAAAVRQGPCLHAPLTAAPLALLLTGEGAQRTPRPCYCCTHPTAPPGARICSLLFAPTSVFMAQFAKHAPLTRSPIVSIYASPGSAVPALPATMGMGRRVKVHPQRPPHPAGGAVARLRVPGGDPATALVGRARQRQKARQRGCVHTAWRLRVHGWACTMPQKPLRSGCALDCRARGPTGGAHRGGILLAGLGLRLGCRRGWCRPLDWLGWLGVALLYRAAGAQA